jgi:hypothetical protein
MSLIVPELHGLGGLPARLERLLGQGAATRAPASEPGASDWCSRARERLSVTLQNALPTNQNFIAP